MLNPNDILKLPVTIKMKDGRELTGDIIANLGGELTRLLNNEMRFVIFIEEGQPMRYIAKDSLLEVTPAPVQQRQRVA